MHLSPLLPLTLALAACAGIPAEELIPDNVAVVRRHGGVAQVTAVGGGPISDEALTEALRTALETSRMFDRADGGDDADWRVTARIVRLVEPAMALDMTAAVTLRWELLDAAGQTRWSERIATDFTSTPEDQIDIEKRGDYALSAAVRANLGLAIDRLAALEPAAGGR